jgi:alcohol dehydrogenase, propanol-preferring
MRAAIFDSRSGKRESWLSIEDMERPAFQPGRVLLKVAACGVCRTDLHIVEGDLPPVQPRIIPGHQIVGEVVEGATADLPLGMRVGVSWMGGVDGSCWFCRNGLENLCDRPVFTGYTVNGGYAEFALVRADFAYPLPTELKASQIAPLLCAGIIGFRSLRVAGVQHGERVGLYGFGSSASLAIRILQAWNCEVYVFRAGTRTGRPPSGVRLHGSAMRMQILPSSWTAPSRSLQAERSWWRHCRTYAKVGWWRSTPFTSTRCPPSTTTSCFGANARCAVWPT